MDKEFRYSKDVSRDEKVDKELAERDLFIEFIKTKNSVIRKDLISRNVGIVMPVAKKYMNFGENFEDLLQVGYIGLIKAVDNYDPERDIKFSTYGIHCVEGEIRHHLRDKAECIKRPRWLRKLNLEVSQFIEFFVQENQRLPHIGEIASEMNISEEGVIEIFLSGKIVSLDAENSHDTSNRLELNNIKSIHYETFRLPLEDRIMLEESVEKLEDMEKKIIYLIFYQDLTQVQVAVNLGLSQKKVSRMLKKVLDKMRKTFFK